MDYHRGVDRSQVEMLPACVEDYVEDNAPVRAIDVYVEGLNFQALGFKQAQLPKTGRPPYHPADLLKLYLYGYLNRIRSSRRLEAEAGRNLELMWLLRGLRPDFKTIADFRKDNRKAFKALFRDFNLLCRRLDLFGAQLVAIDGSKFKAVNNSRHNYSQEKLLELRQHIEGRIEEYLQEIDRQDADAQGVAAAPSGAALKEKLDQLKAAKGRYDALLSQLQESGQKEVSLTDADSRKMKGAHGEHFVGYNVQVAVDAKHHLIVSEEVVQAANDRNELAQMAEAAKAQLEVPTLQAVADAGYHQADQLEACEQAAIETFVSAQGTTSGQGKDGREIFPKERFIYNKQADTYLCPAGQTLSSFTRNTCRGKPRLLYRNMQACRQCPLKAQCTSGRHREIARSPNEAAVERAAQRVKERPQIVAARKTIVEHVFGSMRMWGHDRFLMRGLEKVRAEFSLSALVYNMRRVLNLVSLEELVGALKNPVIMPAKG